MMPTIFSAFADVRRTLALGLSSCLALGAPGSSTAQDTSLTAERIVPYATGKIIPLKAKVGPVSIESVEFVDRGRGSSTGVGGIIRGAAGGSDTQTVIRSHFVVENPSEDEWAVTFTIEFRDKAGRVIDRATGRSAWEGEAKPYDYDHPILEYVVPSIAQVRIRIEGRLD